MWYPATAGEDLKPQGVGSLDQIDGNHMREALRVACQRALDTTETLQSNIERLSWRARDRSQTHSRTCSQTHSQSHSRSHSRSRSRSCSRACSQSHPQSSSQSRQPRSPDRPPPGRRVTFREPEVEPNSEGSVGGLPIRTLCFGCGDMARVTSPTIGHNNMVVRAQGHSGSEGLAKTCSQDSSPSICLKLGWELPGTRIHCASHHQMP